MRAVHVDQPLAPADLTIGNAPDASAPGPGEILLDITHTALNRADLAQRAGNYPPPPGASNILGLEAAGIVRAVGAGVTTFAAGDRAAALLTAGGYAEAVTVPAAQAFTVPDSMPLAHAAALPETLCTVVSNVFMLSALQPGERILVHGGAGGIGITTIQLALQYGAEVVATVGSAEKATVVAGLGATVINYRERDFAAEVRELGGVDVVLDSVGGAYLSSNVKALRRGGRLIVIGLQQGRHGELDLGALMVKRLSVHGTTLRSRPAVEKAAICARVRDEFWPLFTSGQLAPIIDCIMPWHEVAAAHERMELSAHTGKIVLEITPERPAHV